MIFIKKLYFKLCYLKIFINIYFNELFCNFIHVNVILFINLYFLKEVFPLSNRSCNNFNNCNKNTATLKTCNSYPRKNCSTKNLKSNKNINCKSNFNNNTCNKCYNNCNCHLNHCNNKSNCGLWPLLFLVFFL